MITVRLAQPGHLSDIVAFAAKEYLKTNYLPDLPFNSVLARRTLKAGMTDKDSRVWIAQRGGDITGVLIGQLYPGAWFAKLQATDTAFIAAAGGGQLIDAFKAWCKLRGVARIDMGVSASGDSKAMDRFFRMKGFQRGGGMYHIHLGKEYGAGSNH